MTHPTSWRGIKTVGAQLVLKLFYSVYDLWKEELLAYKNVNTDVLMI